MKAVNPKKFTMQLGGIPIRSGYAPGEFFTAEPQSDSVDSVAGTDGEVAVSVQFDRRWDITLKLLQSSDANSVLSQLHLINLRADGTVGFFPVLFKHADTGEYLIGPNCCVARPPAMPQDKTATTREWKLLLTEGEYGFANLSALARTIGRGT